MEIIVEYASGITETFKGVMNASIRKDEKIGREFLIIKIKENKRKEMLVRIRKQEVKAIYKVIEEAKEENEYE